MSSSMTKKILYVLMILFLVGLPACKKSPDVPANPVDPGDPGGGGGEEPGPQEKLIGKMFFHDTGPQSQYDIFTADLYIVPKDSAQALSARKVQLFGPGAGREIVEPGIRKFHHLEINGRPLERVVLNTHEAIDISQYDFEVRDVENITNSVSDDFAVNVNSDNWITFVTAPNGLAGNSGETEIVYMDMADRVRHQLTPINGLYSGNNFDPDWKTDTIIVWSHNGRIMETDITQLTVTDSIIPEVGGSLFDPKYSPDRSMILFNTRQNRKKNSYIKYMDTGTIQTVLPTDYFAAHGDDNPTWIFSNSRITGHIFMDGRGRIYTLTLGGDDFLIITDGSRDFRYVTPIMLEDDLYLVFSDWTDPNEIGLWIANENGTYLRELDQSGDENVFYYLGLPAPESPEEYRDICRQYADQFE